MFDFKNLLGMVMESGASRSGMGRMKHALGDQGLGGQNGLLGGLLGDMGNFPMAFAICAVACGIGALCITMVVTPDHEEASQSISVHGFLHQMHMDRFADVIEHAIHPDHFQRVAAPVRNRRAA